MDDVKAEILNILSSTGLTHSQNMWLVLASFSVLLFFVSSIGICFYKLWAKKLYIFLLRKYFFNAFYGAAFLHATTGKFVQ